MKIDKKEVWAIIPARGGSKSIPLKNMVKLCGRPLIDYTIEAAKKSRRITRIICSTEDARIADFCKSKGIEVHIRPQALAQDDSPVLKVLEFILKDLYDKEREIADLIPLLQVTSPFLLPEHIDKCVELLGKDDSMDSAQTVYEVPHNHHAYNQRFIEDNILRFKFKKEKRRYYNKQSKPKLYVYGNLIVTRSRTILKKKDIFGDKSLPYVITRWYSLDVDKLEDLEMAELMLKNGKVSLPHLSMPQ